MTVHALSEWVKAIRHLVKRRVYFYVILCLQDLRLCLKIRRLLRFWPDVHDKYVVVPADQVFNNVVFVCRKYYIICLIKELGMGSVGEKNKTYQTTNFSKQEILSNHKSVIPSHGIYRHQIRTRYRYYIGYLNCTHILISKDLLQDHPLVQLNHCPNY